MPDIDRRVLIAAPIIALVLFALGFGLGSLLSGGSDGAQANGGTTPETSGTASSVSDADTDTPTSTATPIDGDAAAAIVPPKTDAADISEYGKQGDREQFISDLALAGVIAGSVGDILATADRICYNLERLDAQDRSPAFAVRVVWNESLAELESGDLAAFAAVFAAAPFYLCPDSVEYASEVSYWLGY